MTIPVLVITGMNFPPYSYRGVAQTLEPIQAISQLRRTVNGALTDISNAMFRKYASTITANDQETPEFQWPGPTCTVDCIAELGYKTSGGSPGRTVVSGSSRIVGAFTFYRPQLIMKIVSWSLNHDEWGRQIGWSLGLEEV